MDGEIYSQQNAGSRGDGFIDEKPDQTKASKEKLAL